MPIHQLTHLEILLTQHALYLNLARIAIDPRKQLLFVLQDTVHDNSGQIKLNRQTPLQLLQSILFWQHEQILAIGVFINWRNLQLLNGILSRRTHFRTNSAHINTV